MGFGRDLSLRCPYHVDATPQSGPGCGIWRHRQSMCTTWFCKFTRGEVGKTFWADLHKLLVRVEHSLKWWAVLQCDFSPAALKHLAYLQQPSAGRVAVPSPGRLDLEVDDARYAVLWDAWLGREADFFKEAGARVAALTWPEILHIGGPELDLHVRIVQSAYERLMSTDLPYRLRLGTYEVVEATPERTRLVAYSKLDPLDVPTVLTHLLPYFDGRPTLEVLDQIRNEAQLNLSEGLVRKLVDYAILTAV
jgi:hypothetical protein